MKLFFKNDNIIVQCCVCKKFKMVDGTYAHVNVVSNKVSHTYCQDCNAVIIAEFLKGEELLGNHPII
jgi:hypothetical protein